ncbi:MAG: hypothetical protein EBZ99_03540 [Actinobacteria bacterium]|nr:hypothetical protein [Actinomycetota bacterium]
MLSIIKEIRSGFQQLFPGGRFRYVLIVLSVLAAVISVSELLVMKFFVNIVVQEGDIDRNQFILLGSGMALFFLLTRLSQYYQKTYRVKAFATLFTQGTQLLAVLLFFAIIEPIFALANLFVILIVLTWIGRIFKKHLVVQEKLHMRVDGKRARPQKGATSHDEDDE